MNYLFPVHRNNLGSIYAFKSDIEEPLQSSEKFQLQLAEVAIIFTLEELKSLLKFINTSGSDCNCSACNSEPYLKLITCKTAYTRVILKFNKDRLKDFEALIEGALFTLEMATVLDIDYMG